MKVKVLFVCTGNICRSPSAAAVFWHHVEQAGCQSWIEVDSAGTHGYHVGAQADSRSIHHAQKRLIDLSAHRARQVTPVDFETYDYILAMDQENMDNLIRVCPPSQQIKLQRFLLYAEGFSETEVPDPYYGGAQGFERVLDLIEAASVGLLSHLQALNSKQVIEPSL